MEYGRTCYRYPDGEIEERPVKGKNYIHRRRDVYRSGVRAIKYRAYRSESLIDDFFPNGTYFVNGNFMSPCETKYSWEINKKKKASQRKKKPSYMETDASSNIVEHNGQKISMKEHLRLKKELKERRKQFEAQGLIEDDCMGYNKQTQLYSFKLTNKQKKEEKEAQQRKRIQDAQRRVRGRRMMKREERVRLNFDDDVIDDYDKSDSVEEYAYA